MLDLSRAQAPWDRKPIKERRGAFVDTDLSRIRENLESLGFAGSAWCYAGRPAMLRSPDSRVMQWGPFDWCSPIPYGWSRGQLRGRGDVAGDIRDALIVVEHSSGPSAPVPDGMELIRQSIW